MKKFMTYGFLGVVLLGALAIAYSYHNYQSQEFIQKQFDLFLFESLDSFNEGKYGERGAFDWGIHDRVEKKKVRPMEWKLSKSEFHRLDSITLSLKNVSGEDLHYLSWGRPFSRLGGFQVIHRDGRTDSIRERGSGCATGTYLELLKSEEFMEVKILNPLMFNPNMPSNNLFDLKNDSFPQLFKEAFGDSVEFCFEQESFAVPWSKYPSQLLVSPSFTVSTQKVIENWREGDFIVVDWDGLF